MTKTQKVLFDAAKKSFPNAYARYLQWQHRKMPLTTRIVPLLASGAQPICFDEHFEKLQSSYTQWWPEYGYDSYSTWARGCERAIKLLRIPALRLRDLAVFEAGCGDGMTGYALTTYGNVREVQMNDNEDWRDSRASSFPFVKGNMCHDLPVPSSSFDLVITYNTFEHVEDPKAALTELVRVCKKGGLIYVEFSPLYCSPLGLHSFSFKMPYPQFLFSPSLIETKVRELGVNDLGEDMECLQPTNKWRIAQFREIWRNASCDVVNVTESPERRHLWIVTEFPEAFCGRNLTLDDLEIAGVAVMLRKK